MVIHDKQNLLPKYHIMSCVIACRMPWHVMCVHFDMCVHFVMCVFQIWKEHHLSRDCVFSVVPDIEYDVLYAKSKLSPNVG